MKNNYTPAYFQTQFMAKKTIILGNILLILLVIAVYSFSGGNQPKKRQNEITIFTLEPLLGIHAKMITGDDKNIYIANDKKLSKTELTQLNESNIILSSKLISESEIGKELQSYRWLYITIPNKDSVNTKTHSPALLTSQIELIRDTLSDVTPSLRGYYYDNAGNYIHLINNTLGGLKVRIDNYTPTSFITIGDNLSNFLQILGIEGYRAKNYPNPAEFLADKTAWDLLKEKNINYIFITGGATDSDMKKIRSNYPNVILYQTPSLEADTSRYGYIRFAEKLMNDFVAAFDTYD